MANNDDLRVQSTKTIFVFAKKVNDVTLNFICLKCKSSLRWGTGSPHQKSEFSIEDPEVGQGVHIRRVSFQARIQMGDRGPHQKSEFSSEDPDWGQGSTSEE